MLHTTSNALVLVPQPSCMYFRVLLHRHLYSVDYLDCTAFMYGAFEGALCLGDDVRVLLHRHYSCHFQASRLVVITALQTKTNKERKRFVRQQRTCTDAYVRIKIDDFQSVPYTPRTPTPSTRTSTLGKLERTPISNDELRFTFRTG